MTTLLKIVTGLCMMFGSQWHSVSSQTTSTSCDDAYECEDETISTTYTMCYGYHGCDSANITSTYVYNYGDYGSYTADIKATNIYNYGYVASYLATIETSYIYSYGYLSAYSADIAPLTNSLYGYFVGYFAGYYADVSCFDGDTCNVYCGSSYGCYNMKFYCYSGATCHYDCSDDPDYCPILYSGVSSSITFEGDNSESFGMLSDNEITTHYQENKQMKKVNAKSPEANVITLKDGTKLNIAHKAPIARSRQVSNLFNKYKLYNNKYVWMFVGIISFLLVKMIVSKMYYKCYLDMRGKISNESEYQPLVSDSAL